LNRRANAVDVERWPQANLARGQSGRVINRGHASAQEPQPPERRSMGRHVGISHSTVQRIWAKNDLKPHISKTFKLSNDPKFEEKFWDVFHL
jgi:hypothetical protein